MSCSILGEERAHALLNFGWVLLLTTLCSRGQHRLARASLCRPSRLPPPRPSLLPPPAACTTRRLARTAPPPTPACCGRRCRRWATGARRSCGAAAACPQWSGWTRRCRWAQAQALLRPLLAGWPAAQLPALAGLLPSCQRCPYRVQPPPPCLDPAPTRPPQHFSTPDGAWPGGQKPYTCKPLDAWYAGDPHVRAGGAFNEGIALLIPRIADGHLRTW